jgi:hypothetical protein
MFTFIKHEFILYLIFNNLVRASRETYGVPNVSQAKRQKNWKGGYGSPDTLGLRILLSDSS